MGPTRDLLLGMHEPSSIQELSFPSEPFLDRLTAASACSPWPYVQPSVALIYSWQARSEMQLM